MRSTHLLSSVRGLLFTFRPCFSAATFKAFAAFVVGWLLAQGPRTLTGALQAARGYGLWRRHHAGFYRLLSSARWCCDQVGGVLFRLLLPYLPDEIDVAMDDTLCHRSGPQIFGVGMHHDAAQGTYGGGGGRRVAVMSVRRYGTFCPSSRTRRPGRSEPRGGVWSVGGRRCLRGVHAILTPNSLRSVRPSVAAHRVLGGSATRSLGFVVDRRRTISRPVRQVTLGISVQPRPRPRLRWVG